MLSCDPIATKAFLDSLSDEEALVALSCWEFWARPEQLPPPGDWTTWVLDAASLGADPDALSLPAGQSDGACAPVAADVLAANVAANYGAARSNAEQLNALEAWIRAEADASKVSP